MLQSLPHLEHLSFFADSSDDLTLSLTLSPCSSSSSSLFKRLTKNLRSLGWRQRESPPEGWRAFMSSSTFISIIGLIERCNRLGFLVLDADLTSELGVGVGGEEAGGGGGDESGIGRTGMGRIRKEEGMWEEDVWEVLNALEERKRVIDEEEGKDGVRELGEVHTPRKRSRLRKTPKGLKTRELSSSSEMMVGTQTRSHSSTTTTTTSSSMGDRDDDGDSMMSESRESSGPTTSIEDEDQKDGDRIRRPILRLPSRIGGGGESKASENRSPIPPIEKSSPCPVSLMLCGPIRGWTPSREALGWAERHLKRFYTRATSIGERGYLEESSHDEGVQDRPRSRQRSELRDMIRDHSHHRGGSPVREVSLSDYRYPPIQTSALIGMERSPSSSPSSRDDEVMRGGPKDDPRPRVFLDGVVERFNGLKELFIDRPVRVRAGSGEGVLKLLAIALLPLSQLPKLTLLQIGGYPLTTPDQLLVTNMVASQCDRLLVVGWLGLEGETNWYGIWRRKLRSRARERQEVKGKQKEVVYEDEKDGWPWDLGTQHKGEGKNGSEKIDGGFEVKPLADGDLFKLEAELKAWEEAQAQALAQQNMQHEQSTTSRGIDSSGSHSSASSGHTLGWHTHGPLSSDSLASLRSSSSSVISNSAAHMSSVPTTRPHMVERGSSIESTVIRLRRLGEDSQEYKR